MEIGAAWSKKSEANKSYLSRYGDQLIGRGILLDAATRADSQADTWRHAGMPCDEDDRVPRE
ncbi:MAG: hypothetical protein KGL26_05350 [Pseudomonadota bacterium]|nr:hypothetical protein [Pseudomonadota bacterium]